MSEEDKKEEQAVLNMSDEDLMNMEPPADMEPEKNETKEEEQPGGDPEPDTEEDKGEESTASDESSSDEAEPSPTDGSTSAGHEGDGSDDSAGEDTDAAKSKQSSGDAIEPLDKGDDTSEEKTADQGLKKDIDYKAEYEKLIAPFKANGRMMHINGVDDALALMKMGANYNKKMVALKPNIKLMKMLEKNDLLDENKLNFLIDLDKKNPDAINKLIKDSGLDPLELEDKKDTEYKPNTYNVNDKEIEIDAVLDEIRDTDSFNTTIDIVGNKWDEKSKQVLLEYPAIIKIINDQVETGIYDQIVTIVEKERMLGRLNGLSDIEAYKKVGDAIQAVNGFKTQQQPAPDNQNQSQQDTATPSAKTVQTEDPKLKERRKAASSTKSSPSSKKKDSDFNPLSLSDEEFDKIASSQFG